MSPVKNLGVLAFASAVLAVPHSHNHRHLHARVAPGAYSDPSSAAAPAYGASSTWSSSAAPVSSSAPYHGSGNDTSPYGTGYGSGYAAPTGSYSVSFLPCPTSTCSVYTTTYFWRGSSSVATLTDGQTAATPASYTPASAPSAPVSSPVTTDGCAPDTTITTKVTETVTVTAGPVASTSAAPAPSYGGDSSSAAAAPSYGGDSSSAAAAPTYGGDGKWASDPSSWGGYTKSYEAPTSSAAPVSSAPSYGDGSSAAPAPTSYGSPSASASAPAYSGSPSSGGGSSASPFSGKRGVAYNDVTLTTPFLASSDFGWGYNWGQTSGGLSSKLSYIPELHTADDASTWAANAKSAIGSGSKYLFFINEPDMPSQGNMDAKTAADLWRTNMEPFAGQATLVAPAVSSSNTAGQGLDWLNDFMSECSDCTIGAINMHWYDGDGNDTQGFKDHISQGTSQFGLPAFIGEFGFTGSDSDISSALDDVLGWLDSNNDVLGYAYFYVSDGLLMSGSTPSSYGLTYLNSS